MNTPPESSDPQWGFTLAIRAALETHGSYSVEVDTRDAQARVDIYWAARQAGRLLGAKVTIEKSSTFGHADSIVTMTVRCSQVVDSDRRRVEAGLDRLLHAVEATQERTCTALARAAARPRRTKA